MPFVERDLAEGLFQLREAKRLIEEHMRSPETCPLDPIKVYHAVNVAAGVISGTVAALRIEDEMRSVVRSRPVSLDGRVARPKLRVVK